MTTAWPSRLPAGVGTTGWAQRLLVTIHIPVVVTPVAYVLMYSRGVSSSGDVALVIVLGVAAGVIQVRHSIAATRGEAPPGWPWTLAALIALAYIPLPGYGLSWGIVQASVIASGLMLLRPRGGIALTAIVLLIATGFSLHAYLPRDEPARLVYDVLGGLLFDLVAGLALFGAARLVRVLDELESARRDLAELAVGRERLRVSRDLHDLLGQSLSAVSLKGDLAIRLLDRSPLAAREEIQSLTAVARQALRGVRAITRAEHVAALAEETEGAAALLRVADIDVTVHIDLPTLDRPQETVLAWAVREGVTNVLRHSRATSCEIRSWVRDGVVVLELENDGAGVPAPLGNGLLGLTERARAAAGSLSVRHSVEGRFCLRLELPLDVYSGVTE